MQVKCPGKCPLLCLIITIIIIIIMPIIFFNDNTNANTVLRNSNAASPLKYL